jgi:hypothetical protein
MKNTKVLTILNVGWKPIRNLLIPVKDRYVKSPLKAETKKTGTFCTRFFLPEENNFMRTNLV